MKNRKAWDKIVWEFPWSTRYTTDVHTGEQTATDRPSFNKYWIVMEVWEDYIPSQNWDLIAQYREPTKEEIDLYYKEE